MAHQVATSPTESAASAACTSLVLYDPNSHQNRAMVRPPNRLDLSFEIPDLVHAVLEASAWNARDGVEVGSKTTVHRCYAYYGRYLWEAKYTDSIHYVETSSSGYLSGVPPWNAEDLSSFIPMFFK